MDDAAVPEPVRAAWQRVQDGWNEAAPHDALLALVSQHACYAWAAAKYRERAGDPVADRQLERLRRAATAQMMATASPRPESRRSPYDRVILLMIGLVLLAGTGVLYASCRHAQVPPQPPPPPPHARTR